MRATIMTRPVQVGTTPTTTPTEPRPRGDRPVGIPPTPTHAGLLCTGRTVRAGLIKEMTEDDDKRGPERDETDNRFRPVAFSLGTPLLADPDRQPLPQREPGKTLEPEDALHRLVGHLVADGDQRAARAGRRARRTLREMSPGSAVQPRLAFTGSAVA
ncbi:hypothetical protein ACFRKB_34945 [Streptomyces scopuliridis]|uniref:hypothetical protein n=1 Tax=Streptomyces scopuliridis TaxID=452529 RepID=UPI00369FBBFF